MIAPAGHPGAQRDPRRQREGRDRHRARRRPAGPEVQGRAHDGGDRRRHDDPRVHDDQPRHDPLVQDDGGEALLHHVVRAPRARLPRGRRRDPREQRAARRARDGGRQGDHRRRERGAPVREDRPVLVRRRLLAHLAGRAAVREGGGQPDQALWPEQRGAAAEQLPRGRRARAEARLSDLLPVGAQRHAGQGARGHGAEAAARGAGAAALRRGQRPRGRSSDDPRAHRGHRRRRAGAAPHPDPARPAGSGLRRLLRVAAGARGHGGRGARRPRLQHAGGAARRGGRGHDRRAHAGALRRGEAGARRAASMC